MSTRRTPSKSPPATRSKTPTSRSAASRSGLRYRVTKTYAENSVEHYSYDSKGEPWQFFSSNPEKAWTEKFFLLWAVAGWIPMMIIVVATGAYEDFGRWSYLFFTLSMALPCWLIPLYFRPGNRRKPFWEQYWFKDNLWILVLGYVGNYFWTHYFYNLLGAGYTFTAHRINNVPISMFLATHAYFCFYHALTNIALRLFWQTSVYNFLRRVPFGGLLGSAVYVFALSVFTAFMETFTIQSFPYYYIKDRQFMYTIGSVIYGIYFIVSFPLHYRIEPQWSVSKVVMESLAGCMIVTILLDLARLIFDTQGLPSGFCM